ncbi:MAG: outer membrane lipoprotein-sorting protein [Spirochaetales bacterium]|nr:outer membrane lipoprotein-sorting protein [Spirochaetales bacterium]
MNRKQLLLAGFILVPLLAVRAQTAAKDGTEIMRQVEARPERSSESTTMQMIITDKRGKTRERELHIYRSEQNGLEASLMFFLDPADVRGVGFLSLENKKGGDDQWLYMPAMKRTNRIASSSKKDDFMGTDFSYEDLETVNAGKDVHTWLRQETVDGRTCEVIESVPKGKSAYSKRISWIDPETLFALRIDFFDSKGTLVKRLSVSDIRKTDGYWSAWKMEMINLLKNRSTVLITTKTESGTVYGKGFFTVGTLEKGAGL